MTAEDHTPTRAEHRTTVLLADDDGSVCQLLSIALSLEGDFEIVGVARDGRSVIELADELPLSPDVLVLDVSMPLTSCADVGRHFRERHPATRIVVHSGHTGEELDERLRGLIPDEVLCKGADITTLAERLRACASRPAVEAV